MNQTIRKYRKQVTNSQISIKIVFWVLVVVAGCCLWGKGFLAALAVVYLGWPVLRALLSFICGIAILIGLMYLILSCLTL